MMPELNWEFDSKDYQIVTEQYLELERLKDKEKSVYINEI